MTCFRKHFLHNVWPVKLGHLFFRINDCLSNTLLKGRKNISYGRFCHIVSVLHYSENAVKYKYSWMVNIPHSFCSHINRNLLSIALQLAVLRKVNFPLISIKHAKYYKSKPSGYVNLTNIPQYTLHNLRNSLLNLI